MHALVPFFSSLFHRFGRLLIFTHDSATAEPSPPLDREGPPTSKESWREVVARYQTSSTSRAWRQILNSFLPYIAIWMGMIWSLGVSYWITLGLALIAAGFLIRIFIIFHDCGHGSFFRSRRANDFLGFVCGVLAFTPYYYWHHNHARHHATAGNLDRRGLGGDIWAMTLAEYRESSLWKRVRFRIFRNPVFLFLISPGLLFFIQHRFARRKEKWRWHRSVLMTNLALLGLACLVSSIIGVRAYLLIQLPTMMLAGSAGVWLFYVQHQFDGVYWERNEDWDYLTAALEGSSYYKLPRVLQWVTGNIGFHHVHHLGPRIPNYLLDKCHHENMIFHRVKPLRLRESLGCLKLRLWDSDAKRMVSVRPFFL